MSLLGGRIARLIEGTFWFRVMKQGGERGCMRSLGSFYICIFRTGVEDTCCFHNL